MPDDAALLDAVLRDPEDDAPRLAYAEASSDDARNAFIRHQVELALCEPDDPDRVRLYTESEELLAEHEARWQAPLEGLADDVTFHRGFVERVGLTADGFLEAAEALFARCPILHLDIKSVEPSRLPTLLESEHLERLVSISFDGCGLGTTEMGLLASAKTLSGVRWLSLAKNQIDYAGAARLAEAAAQFPALRYVNFADNPVDLMERQAVDAGVILEKWLPEDAVRLEQEYGELAWLHSTADLTREIPLNRFKV